MTVQFIEIAGQKMVILPEAEYRSLADQAEERADVEAAERAEARRVAGEEYVPASLVERLVNGEAGLLVWREYRDLSQQALGDKVGLSKMTISSLERGKRDTSAKNWRALADALSVDVDDIMPFD
ncbi:MAG: helix-turn-helix transcriptional regulator [Sphingopyxis sp.]|uniref:helix-turn-helix transcriptional regulator n=1 Tax=Sphingopyxis sp. TaxID=1908224 RepID=UPI003D811A25